MLKGDIDRLWESKLDVRRELNLRALSPEERKVMEYFMHYLSVGELIAFRELRTIGIRKPEEVVADLLEKGLLEKGDGCYNVPKELRMRAMKSKGVR